MNSQRILTTSIICLLTMCSLSLAEVETQNPQADTAASYLERGNEWMAKGELDRAIADYDLAIAFDARIAVAYYNRGLARQREGDLEGTLSDFDRAIQFNPRHVDAYLNRGDVRYWQGQFAAEPSIETSGNSNAIHSQCMKRHCRTAGKAAAVARSLQSGVLKSKSLAEVGRRASSETDWEL